jgi:hypothetical protein
LRPYIHAGWINSLTQTLLKMTPGIPDIYQGSETGDFSLVDPDNRRAVDFISLPQTLTEPLPTIDRAALVGGRMKQKLIAASLSYRRTNPALFAFGSYEPLRCAGSRPDKVIAFSPPVGIGSYGGHRAALDLWLGLALSASRLFGKIRASSCRQDLPVRSGVLLVVQPRALTGLCD